VFENTIIIWLYCYCSNYEKVINRIKKRFELSENEGSQADDVTVYDYILKHFDMLCIEQFSKPTIIISIDTDENKLTKIESNFIYTDNELLLPVFNFIKIYLENKKRIMQ